MDINIKLPNTLLFSLLDLHYSNIMLLMSTFTIYYSLNIICNAKIKSIPLLLILNHFLLQPQFSAKYPCFTATLISLPPLRILAFRYLYTVATLVNKLLQIISAKTSPLTCIITYNSLHTNDNEIWCFKT